MNTSAIKKEIWNILRSNGFAMKNGSELYTLKEDIVSYCILECPTNFVYIWFGFYPLYMPPLNGPYMIYGCRLNTLYCDLNISSKFIQDKSAMQEICINLDRHLKKELLPTTESIRTAPILKKNLLEIQSGLLNIYRGNPLEMCRLEMFTCLFLHDLTGAMKAVCKYKSIVNTMQLTVLMKNRALDELQLLIALLQSGESNKIDKICNRWRNENELYYMKKCTM